MSGDESDPPRMTSVAGLRYSLGTLFERFGTADNPAIGILINGSLALVGIALAIVTSGLVQWAAGVWALVNLMPIVQWVMA